jgi:mono/diheme cytochrome c family protein
MTLPSKPFTTPENAEPSMGTAPVPVWVWVVFLVVLFWAMLYFDQRSGWFHPLVYSPYKSLPHLQSFQPPTGGPDLERGRSVYDNVCALCHNTDGTGKPNQAPTFVGSEWVTGSSGRLIRIPLHGLVGPIEVNGETWNLAMPAMGAALSDEDLAALLTYMRQSWGNKASPITADQVKAVREEVGNRPQPWTAEELSTIP